MNKEEEVIIKILEKYKYDCDGTELKNIVQEALISFMDYTKIQDLDEINRFYRIYALMYWAIKDLQSKLDIANKHILEARAMEDKLSQQRQENEELKKIIKDNTVLVKDEYGDYQECTIDPIKLQQENKQLKELLDKIYEYCEDKIKTLI